MELPNAVSPADRPGAIDDRRAKDQADTERRDTRRRDAQAAEGRRRQTGTPIGWRRRDVSRAEAVR